jgi:regulator of protease activity HflC (stomatin/prohibitin superfamily)
MFYKEYVDSRGRTVKQHAIMHYFYAAISILIFFIWLCNWTIVRPGTVGVVVDLFGSSKGVEDKELSVGMHWIAPWKSVYRFPTFEQNDTWQGNECFSFQTAEGLACDAEVGITYHLKPEYIPKVFSKYRRGMYEITHIFLRNYIRDAINNAASKLTCEQLYSDGKEKFFRDVEVHVREDVKPIGIEISRIYLIGRIHFPQNVINALNSKIEATQRAQQRENELRESQAEAEKHIAKVKGEASCLTIASEAQAKANELLSQSITSEILAKMAIDKWDGKLPMYIGGSSPVLMPFAEDVKFNQYTKSKKS